MDIDEIKSELMRNNVNRILNLATIMINSLNVIDDADIKAAYTRIHDDAMAAKRLIDKA